MIDQGKESSMEEILSSIKRIIAEDHGDDSDSPESNEKSHKSLIANSGGNDVTGDRDDELDVLDLTETDEDEILELTEEVVPEKLSTSGVFGRNDRRRDDRDRETTSDGNSRLIDDRKLDSMRQSLSALVAMEKAGDAPVRKQTGETSLEDMTRELMRPMLREWLDENLPSLVEELVAREIKRISQK